MATSGKTEFEINGLRFEAPTSERLSASALKVGDRVKLLQKKYDDTYEAKPGLIVAIDLFENLPTVTVMYAEYSYASPPELKFLGLNAKSKEVNLMPMCAEEALVGTREDALEQFARAEKDLLQKLETLRERREFFLRRFGVAFGWTARDLKPAEVPAELAVTT